MVSRREWRAAYAERLRAQQQEEAEHNEWLASRGLPPRLTDVVFLVPVAGLFWLATWMHSRAFAGRDPRWRRT
ncbi:hypothetical protein DWB68_07175 [Galactobacter valiniphilus]|uniref:Uncharacterized protein n=1 Tax=Galactobacter valiniphilus TaxID=2676122 RepID=A0A399JEJ2_9MICC|nr:hypothetical protein [Galactobacter valiniphilus]RII42522.1 hypothetical protein DWB68_07175 [Galactobacter valiniphilus]